MPLFDRQPSVTNIAGYSLLTDTANSVADTVNTVVAAYLEPIGCDTFSSTCPTCHAFHHRSSGMSPSLNGNGSGSGSNGAAATMHNHPMHAPCRACEAERRRSKATDWILAVLTVMCPPAVAYIKTGKRDFWLNVILTLFGWAPGMLHSWYLIILHPGVHHRHEQVWRENDPECYRQQPEDTPYVAHHGRGYEDAPAGSPFPATAAAAIAAPASPAMTSSATATPATTTRAGGHWRDSKDTPPSYAASS